MEKFNSTEEIFEYLDNVDVDSLNYEEAEDFCKFIEAEDKGVINEFTMKVSYTTNENIARAIVKYVTSENSAVRNLAGELLISMGQTSINPLLEALPDGDKHKKKFIIDVLGLIGDVKVEDAIIKLLNQEKDENVILACVEALGNIKSEKSVEYLINLYSVNELFIPSIIEALGKIASEKALDFIMSSYQNEDPLIKFSIIESLGSIGNEKSFYFLVGELPNLEGPISWVAIDSLFKLSNKLGLEIPFDEIFKRKVLDTIYEADEQYKKSAVYLLLPYNDKETIKAFLHVYGFDPELDEIIKDKFFNNIKAAAEVFEEFIESEPENLEDLLGVVEELYQYPDFDLKDYLSALEIQSLINTLADVLDSPNEEVRKSAMNLMFKIDFNSATLFVDKMLQDENLWNKLFLIDLLEQNELNEDVINALKKYSEEGKDEMLKERIQDLISQKTIN